MEIRFYKSPTTESPNIIPTAVTYSAPAIRYKSSFYSYGDFNFSISSEYAEVINKYDFVLIDGIYWGFILEVERIYDSSGDSLNVWGLSLDGLVARRKTVPPNFSYEQVGGVAGYDVVDGSTETCMKHFVDRNFFDPLSPSRVIPLFEIAPDLERGIPDDKYMSRFEELPVVLENLGVGAKLGYKIDIDLEAGSIVFDCIEGVDRSATQSENVRVVLSPNMKNITSMHYLDSDRNMCNLFYASLSGGQYVDQTYTATVTRDENLPEGIFRNEQQMDISAQHPTPGAELDELRRLALARAESYETVQTFEATIRNTVYGVDFALGDIVTLKNEEWGITTNIQVTEVEVTGSSSGVVHTVTFGRGQIDPIQRLKRQIRGG